MTIQVKFSIFFLVAICTPLVRADMPSCLTVQGKKFTDLKDLSGKKVDATSLKDMIANSASNRFSALFPSLENAFSKSLNRTAVDQLFQILKCIREFVVEYGRNDKDLLVTFDKLSDQTDKLINTTKIVYNRIFSKIGKITTNKNTVEQLKSDFKTIINDTELIRTQVKKITFFISNKKIARDLLVWVAKIVEVTADKLMRDVDEEIAKRK